MGKIFSSNKDFNRVLTKQPRTSINIPKFESPYNLHERTSTDSFLIPASVRISQIEGQEKNTTSILPNEYVESGQTFKQSNPSPAIERTNLSTVINNEERQKIKEEQSQQQINAQNSSYSIRSNSPTHHEIMTSDPAVISRSFINIKDQQQKRNKFSSSFQPFSTIIERNGEQFLVEFKERTERRYVEYIDETTDQKRVFEVTDCIPYRTIRPYRQKSQYLSQNDISQKNYPPSLQSNRQPVRPPIFDDQPKSVVSSNFIDNRNLNNFVNKASDHDLQHNHIIEPFTNKIPQNVEYLSSTALFPPQSASIPRSTTKHVADSIYQHSQYSQASSLQSLSTDPNNIFDQYSSELFHKQSPLFRAHTSTISDDSASSYTSNSSEEETDTDDSEIIVLILRSNRSLSHDKQMNSYFFDNRHSKTVSFQKNDICSSSLPFDSFPRSLNPSDLHHYEKHAAIKNCAEQVMNHPRFLQSVSPDYSSISIPIKQPNQNQYSHTNDSEKSVYDG